MTTALTTARAEYLTIRNAVVASGKLTAAAFNSLAKLEAEEDCLEAQERNGGPRPEPTPEMWVRAAQSVAYNFR